MDDLIKKAEDRIKFNAMAKSIGWSTNNEIMTNLMERIAELELQLKDANENEITG